MRKKNIPAGYARGQLLILIVFLVGSNSLTAQTSKDIQLAASFSSQKHFDEIQPLTIGDRVPDILFKNIMNFGDGTTSLSNISKKLTILDFWSSWCVSCISLFPHMDTLQKQFGNQIQIVLYNTKSQISGDDKIKISKILERVKKATRQSIDLPVIYNSPELDKYFPCNIIPHEVWIDSTGKVVKITSAAYVNSKNIQSYLNGEDFYAEIKQDLVDYNISKPLFLNPEYSQKKLLNRSSLYSYLDGVSNVSNGIMKDGNSKTIYYINNTILNLYSAAVYPFKYFNKRLILQVRDSSRFFMPEGMVYDEWIRQNGYCYEITAPLSKPDSELRKSMLADLNHYLNLDGRIEKKMINCLVLKYEWEKSALEIKTNSNYSKTNIDKDNNVPKYVTNFPLSILVNYLNNHLDVPIIDETNLNGNITIQSLPNDMTDIKSLSKALKQYGLELVQEKREIEYFVLTE